MAGIYKQYSTLNEAYDPEDEPSTSAVAQASQLPVITKKRTPRHKHKGVLYRIGVAELIMGIVSILLAVATLVIAFQYRYYTFTFRDEWTGRKEYYNWRYYHEMTFSSPGIWSGAVLIASGILGMKATGHPSVCTYNANMTISIIAATLTLPFIVLSAFAAGNNVSYYEHEYRIYSLIAIHSVLAALAFVAGVVCIVHSAYSCSGVCCRKPFTGVVSYYPQPYGVQPTYQFIQISNERFLLVPSPPSASSSSPATPVTIQSAEGDADMPRSYYAVHQQGEMLVQAAQVAPQAFVYPVMTSGSEHASTSAQIES